MTSARSIASAAACLFVLSACRALGLGQEPVEVERTAATTASGLHYEELFLGTGSVADPGDEVTFDYTLWLADGTRVLSTLDRGVPATVTLGEAPFAFWNEGLLGVRPQGRRRLRVPPELGYGAEGVPGLIPPDAELVFEVTVARVEDDEPSAPVPE